MDLARISVATMTLARDPAEEHVLHAALTQLSSLGSTIVVTDGGSSPAFVERIAALPSVRIGAARGLVPQVKLSVAAAASSPFVLYTEPDKRLFFGAPLHAFVAAAPDSPDVGIVLAERSPASFATFPAAQQYTETVANRLCADMIRLEADYFYGPFLMNSALAPMLQRAADTLGWGWRPFLFAMAHRLGYRLHAISGDYPCPPEQRDDEERLHRMRQLAQNVQGLVAGFSEVLPRGSGAEGIS